MEVPYIFIAVAVLVSRLAGGIFSHGLGIVKKKMHQVAPTPPPKINVPKCTGLTDVLLYLQVVNSDTQKCVKIWCMWCRSGLEINILRQWTTGPPSLRIWWSGLKSGGPENYSPFRTIHFHLKFITECVQWSYSFGTDSSPSEQCQWIRVTADDALRVRRQVHGLHNRTWRLSFWSNHRKVLSHFATYFLYGLLRSYSVLHACLPSSPIFFFSPLASQRQN